jgi:hypothetical protein
MGVGHKSRENVNTFSLNLCPTLTLTLIYYDMTSIMGYLDFAQTLLNKIIYEGEGGGVA